MLRLPLLFFSGSVYKRLVKYLIPLHLTFTVFNRMSPIESGRAGGLTRPVLEISGGCSDRDEERRHICSQRFEESADDKNHRATLGDARRTNRPKPEIRGFTGGFGINIQTAKKEEAKRRLGLKDTQLLFALFCGCVCEIAVGEMSVSSLYVPRRNRNTRGEEFLPENSV
ncbi:Hypothetical predicted protein [Xyrichtys novacula]|uniref:Uncharacterized protein n=1 Tax=Xyrichtys novacula TaxID=13765 RepID=A0AAV1GHL6_XYRNO|nr:Hypothetical predicted protein [Xyrichtys novacula]